MDRRSRCNDTCNLCFIVLVIGIVIVRVIVILKNTRVRVRVSNGFVNYLHCHKKYQMSRCPTVSHSSTQPARSAVRGQTAHSFGHSSYPFICTCSAFDEFPPLPARPPAVRILHAFIAFEHYTSFHLCKFSTQREDFTAATDTCTCNRPRRQSTAALSAARACSVAMAPGASCTRSDRVAWPTA